MFQFLFYNVHMFLAQSRNGATFFSFSFTNTSAFGFFIFHFSLFQPSPFLVGLKPHFTISVVPTALGSMIWHHRSFLLCRSLFHSSLFAFRLHCLGLNPLPNRAPLQSFLIMLRLSLSLSLVSLFTFHFSLNSLPLIHANLR